MSIDVLLQYTPKQLREQGVSEAIIREVEKCQRGMEKAMKDWDELEKEMERFTSILS